MHALTSALERKVRCDLQLPRCNNCTKAKRVCQGYGTKLSWPRNGDRKRAIIQRATHHAVNTHHADFQRFLHSSFWDITLSEELESGTFSGDHYPTTYSDCLVLMAVPCRSLPSYHEISSPDLFISYRYESRRVAPTGVLCVRRLIFHH